MEKDMKELVTLLKKSILFENISDEEIEEILEKSNSKVISVKKDEYLFYQEEESKNLFILLERIVQIEKGRCKWQKDDNE